MNKKIFCIGSNKTGTSSLRELFVNVGLNVSPQKKQEIFFKNDKIIKDNKNIIYYVQMYDFFQDVPFSLGEFFIKLDTLFPNSKFILTIRDADDWFESLCNFHLKIHQRINPKLKSISEVTEEILKEMNWIEKGYSYKFIKNFYVSKIINYEVNYDWRLLYNREHYKKIYTQRNELIINYFQNYSKKDNLIIIDLKKEKNTERLFNFLKIKNSKILKYPHVLKK